MENTEITPLGFVFSYLVYFCGVFMGLELHKVSIDYNNVNMQGHADHYFVMTKMNYRKARVHRERIKYRCFKTVSRKTWESGTGEISDVEELVEYYNEGMSEIRDKGAPVKYKVCTIRSKPELIDSDLTERRRLIRKYERKYRKNQTDHNRDIHVGLQKEYRNRLRWNRERHVNKVTED